MIGTPDSQIVAGYSTPKYEINGTQQALPASLGTTPAITVQGQIKNVLGIIDMLQKSLVDEIVRARKEQRTRKESWETTKNNKMGELTTETARQEYLFKTYVPELRKIGLTKAILETAFSKLDLVRTCKIELNNKLTRKIPAPSLSWVQVGHQWHYRLSAIETSFTLVTLFMGADAYEIAIAKGSGVQRDVWKKKLEPFASAPDFKKGPNEYVKDDNGVFTRRYGYGYKTLAACKHLMDKPTNTLKGRYVAAGKDIKGVDADLQGMYKLDPLKTELTTKEMVFVNQEKGSTDQQRGICLSSAPNKVIHGNKGKTFAVDEDTGKENILIKVDLAQVPEGQEQLYNLYSQDAQAKTIGMAGFKPNGKEFTADWAKEHTDTSTAKNRELFLRELTQDEVANKDHVNAEIKRLDPPPVVTVTI